MVKLIRTMWMAGEPVGRISTTLNIARHQVREETVRVSKAHKMADEILACLEGVRELQ